MLLKVNSRKVSYFDGYELLNLNCDKENYNIHEDWWTSVADFIIKYQE